MLPFQPLLHVWTRVSRGQQVFPFRIHERGRRAGEVWAAARQTGLGGRPIGFCCTLYLPRIPSAREYSRPPGGLGCHRSTAPAPRRHKLHNRSFSPLRQKLVISLFRLFPTDFNDRWETLLCWRGAARAPRKSWRAVSKFHYPRAVVASGLPQPGQRFALIARSAPFHILGATPSWRPAAFCRYSTGFCAWNKCNSVVAGRAWSSSPIQAVFGRFRM